MQNIYALQNSNFVCSGQTLSQLKILCKTFCKERKSQ